MNFLKTWRWNWLTTAMSRANNKTEMDVLGGQGAGKGQISSGNAVSHVMNGQWMDQTGKMTPKAAAAHRSSSIVTALTKHFTRRTVQPPFLIISIWLHFMNFLWIFHDFLLSFVNFSVKWNVNDVTAVQQMETRPQFPCYLNLMALFFLIVIIHLFQVFNRIYSNCLLIISFFQVFNLIHSNLML